MSNEILDNYDKNIKMYSDFKSKIEILLKELLVNEIINYHNISCRVKDKNSLSKKITKKDKYNNINEITDIIGCRIITFFDDDVESVVNTLREEFIIDEKNSINKKDNISSDKFGYLSYHLICKLKDERTELKEYKRYKNIQFEIQIRTILQHAWAEIEHDLGYKSQIEIPSILRRKFSRIAGLLETADETFCDIKNKLNDYNENLQDNNNLIIEDINLDTILQYTSHNEKVKKINNEIMKNSNWDTFADIKFDDFSFSINAFKFFEIKTIKELDDLIIKYEKKIISFSQKKLRNHSYTGGQISNDITYFYLFYILANVQNRVETYLKECNIGSKKTIKINTKEIIDIYLAIKG